MMQLLLVGIGGAAGSVLRFGAQKSLNTTFPWGTMVVNLVGCFIIGALWAAALKGLDEQKRLFFMTGFCGGFTTFSAFTLEGIQMMTTGKFALFFLYTTLSVGCGLLATYLGYKIFQ